MPAAPLRIAIVGSGIAGTLAATLLARAGHHVMLLERSPTLSPVGAGLLLQPSGQSVLSRANLLEDATKEAEPITHLHATTHRGHTLVRLSYPDLSPSTRAYGVHRAHLHSTLHRAAASAGAQTLLSQEITHHTHSPDPIPAPISTPGQSAGSGSDRISADRRSAATVSSPPTSPSPHLPISFPPPPIYLHTTTGATHGPFHLALATDGARSPLRHASPLPHHTHTYPHGALYLTGPCPAIRHHLFQVTRGTRTLCGLLPTGNAHASLFWGLPTRDFDSLRSAGFPAWRDEVLSLCPQAAPLLATHTSFDRVTFTTCHHVHMPRRWHTGRLLFLGDAAHATSPHLGQGVNLALMDAEALATALTQSPHDLPAALANYERARRPHITFYSQLTYLLSPFFQSDGHLKGLARDAVLPLMPRIPYLRRQMLRTLAGNKQGWFT